MKRMHIYLAALAAVTGVAHATDQPIDITATVETFCSIDGTASGTLANKSINLGTFGATGITAASTGTLAAALAVICNTPSNVTLISTNGALVATASGSLQNYINYGAVTTGLPTVQASVTANTTTGVTGTAVTGSIAAQTSAFSANVNVVVTPVAATTLAAGNYADVLTFRIVPQ